MNTIYLILGFITFWGLVISAIIFAISYLLTFEIVELFFELVKLPYSLLKIRRTKKTAEGLIRYEYIMNEYKKSKRCKKRTAAQIVSYYLD